MATEQQTSLQGLIQGLGWFSVGLGLAELITPDFIANLSGLQPDGSTRKLLRLYGARELTAGLGLLSGANPQAWLWARVAGDALDLASLGKALASADNERGKTIMATAAVIGVTVADVYCATKLNEAESEDAARTGSKCWPATLKQSRMQ